MKRALPVLLLALFACTTATAPPPAIPAEPVRITIVGTTDVHGWFAGHDEPARNGIPAVTYGGVATLASYVDALRGENPGRVIVVDSGDMFQGTLESNLEEGEPVIHAYNAIGYAAAAVGNHEFDYGPVGPKVIPETPADDPHGALKRNASIAKFPLLSANMIETATGQTPAWAKKTTMVTVDGVRVGIIGLSTPDTPNVTVPTNVKTLTFTDPVQATIDNARDLRARGADAIVVIAHMGGRCRDLHDVNNVASCETEHEAWQLLNALPRGTIDAYFAGHTHAQMRHFINGVPAAQGLAYSTEFSTIDLWVDRSAKRVIADRSNIRPPTMICTQVFTGTETCDVKKVKAGATLVPRTFAGRTITPEPRVAALMQPYLARVEAKKSERLGIVTAAAITRDYQRESALGDLITDAIRDVMQTEIAFFNSGGIRANLPAGELTYGDVFEVSPFDNFPAVVMMTGAQIREALRATSTGSRGILQVSGLRYTIDEAKDADKPDNDRDRITSVTLENGQPLDPNKLYKVALLDFLVIGGDNMTSAMSTVPQENITIYRERPIRDVIIEGLKRRSGPISPKTDGRITIVNPRRS